MNKLFLYIALFLFSWTVCNSQVLHVDGNNYATIDSYNGIIKTGAYRIWLDGNGTLNLSTWRISVKVTSPISNGSQTFPANKISLLPTTTYGQLNPGPVPTVSQIGMPLQTILQDNGIEVFLVPQSQAGLFNVAAGGNPYYNLFMPFNLKVEGGAYLSSFIRYSEFIVPLEFKFYDNHNNLKGTFNTVYKLQIGHLSGTPPDPTPQFSITIGGNATAAHLELKTKADYIQGTSAYYPNGLRVNANTAYEIKVKSLQPTFISNKGNTLPLNTVQVSLTPTPGNSGAVFPVWLSASSQKIASGSTINQGVVGYDITYISKPNDSNFITVETDNYHTILEFLITTP